MTTAKPTTKHSMELCAAACVFANDYGPLPAANNSEWAAMQEVANRLVRALASHGLKIVEMDPVIAQYRQRGGVAVYETTMSWAQWQGKGPAPASWWGTNPKTGQKVMIYRSYADYCDT